MWWNMLSTRDYLRQLETEREREHQRCQEREADAKMTAKLIALAAPAASTVTFPVVWAQSRPSAATGQCFKCNKLEVATAQPPATPTVPAAPAVCKAPSTLVTPSWSHGPGQVASTPRHLDGQVLRMRRMRTFPN